MTHAWVELTGADGRETVAPTEQQLADTLAEVYARGGQDANEPASASLRFGYDDGLMYVAEVSSSGDASFEEWSDRDCELALAAPRRMRCDQRQAFELWCWLARRQVARIRELGWHSGA